MYARYCMNANSHALQIKAELFRLCHIGLGKHHPNSTSPFPLLFHAMTAEDHLLLYSYQQHKYDLHFILSTTCRDSSMQCYRLPFPESKQDPRRPSYAC